MMRSLIPLYGMKFYPLFMLHLSVLTKSGDPKVATTILMLRVDLTCLNNWIILLRPEKRKIGLKYK